mmetsp:Transcript_14840/g.55877  ORF Transcript_14840/g.55877 Transcript_14840/m.55877 type:complete len:223 (+) Transcript_14840:1252-1920(+)
MQALLMALLAMERLAEAKGMWRRIDHQKQAASAASSSHGNATNHTRKIQKERPAAMMLTTIALQTVQVMRARAHRMRKKIQSAERTAPTTAAARRLLTASPGEKNVFWSALEAPRRESPRWSSVLVELLISNSWTTGMPFQPATMTMASKCTRKQTAYGMSWHLAAGAGSSSRIRPAESEWLAGGGTTATPGPEMGIATGMAAPGGGGTACAAAWPPWGGCW